MTQATEFIDSEREGGSPMSKADPSTAARAFLETFAERDFAGVEACFHPQARFRALIPPGLEEASDAPGAARHLKDWFGGADHFEMTDAAVAAVFDRWRLAYRLRVRDEEGWWLFEQQAYCDVEGGRIVSMDLLCTGPRSEPPVPVNGDEPEQERSAYVAELNLRGKVCPYVTAETHQAVAALPEGGELAVLTDYYPALTTIPAVAGDLGASASAEKVEAGLWRIRIRKGGS